MWILAAVFCANACNKEQSGGTKATEAKKETAASPFSLYPVLVDGKWGYINADGTVAVEPKFDSASAFRAAGSQYSEIQLDGKCGYIGGDGIVTVEPTFDECGSFAEGLAPVRIGKSWGYVGADGKFAVNPQFDEAQQFQQGRAAVRVQANWAYIDVAGKIVINPQFDEAFGFSDDLAAVQVGDKWGFIDLDGKFKINPQFASAFPFSDERSLTRTGTKYGFIDVEGKYVVNPQYVEAFPYCEGLAAVQVDGKFGYIDTEGGMAIPPQFEKGEGFAGGFAAVQVGGKWGFVDHEGVLVINPQFDEVLFPFEGELGIVSKGKDTFWIDKGGIKIAALTKTSMPADLVPQSPPVDDKSSGGKSRNLEATNGNIALGAGWGPSCTQFFAQVTAICKDIDTTNTVAKTSCDAWVGGVNTMKSAVPPDAPAEAYAGMEAGCKASTEGARQASAAWRTNPESANKGPEAPSFEGKTCEEVTDFCESTEDCFALGAEDRQDCVGPCVKELRSDCKTCDDVVETCKSTCINDRDCAESCADKQNCFLLSPGYGDEQAQPSKDNVICYATTARGFHLRPAQQRQSAGPEYEGKVRVAIRKMGTCSRGVTLIYDVQVVEDGQTGFLYLTKSEFDDNCPVEDFERQRLAVTECQ